MAEKTPTILVTGVSGYIAGHVTAGLLQRGYKVRGTVRSLKKGERVQQDLEEFGVDTAKLSFIEADLDMDDGWEDATKDCQYIQHLASPFPMEQPTDREALVPAARAGAQRVLAAGFAANVDRIVLTSSLVSMMGKPGKGAHMMVTEDDWSDPDWRALTAYAVSKTRAELSAWDYARIQGFQDRLTVVNPGFVLGPAIGKTYGTSLALIEQMFKGEFPRTPKACFPIVDVRDLANLHIEAMLVKKAAGRRLIGAGKSLWLREIAAIARAAYPKRGRKLPKGDMPSFIVKIAAIFDNRIKGVLSDLDTCHEVDNAYVTDLTGVSFRDPKQSVLDSCEYLIAQGKI
ncbi:MAG TPA: NAD-dependent epimerase/dehydratase family protein [Hellea balneolensis]|uniref:NAD-dependent epimerase/dehydratase family protein n=1 Tax=Hellea balneolensis TaxID=287478 RepID=A0A7C3GAE5_9PROT|nr:NAD-dependent epimerase/dehydratase family protein [Hellea balneolensis]